jgi:predicted GH43/DUF377 family glycosyl hydrolase
VTEPTAVRLDVARSDVRIRPDPHRVIVKPWIPGEPSPTAEPSRRELFLRRILAIPEQNVAGLLAQVRERFNHRHPDLDAVLRRHCAAALDGSDLGSLSDERRLLIGAYHTHEYSIEAAALTNPSIVPAPDQNGTGDGEQRFVLSLRAIGEGHLSSIEFRTGVVDSRGEVRLDPPGPYAVTAESTPPLYEKALFLNKVLEVGGDQDLASLVLSPLPPKFTMAELDDRIAAVYREGISPAVAFETVKIIHWLATSNYVATFAEETNLSERVLFPSGPNESMGMEDARFVRFVDDDGATMYYATYTAYDGFNILPQMIETEDFRSFRIATLNGAHAQNKGMALFPRRIHGRHAALSRHDRENLHILFSDDSARFWNEGYLLATPRQPWALRQIGNNGSPIETEAGWLVLTHGVGPMRRYALGAMLLDLDDPRQVIASLPEPLLEPGEDERDGYVPNVLYTCGALVHNNHLVVPYGFSDVGTNFATLPLDDLLDALLTHGRVDATS